MNDCALFLCCIFNLSTIKGLDASFYPSFMFVRMDNKVISLWPDLREI